jgi:hypothetical protein
MKSGFVVSAVALALALASSANAQHGAAHGGSMGGSAVHGGFAGRSSGFSGHASSAGHPGFPGRAGFSRPGATRGYNGMARPGLGRPSMTMHSGLRAPYRGTGYTQFRPTQYRPQYQPPYAAHASRRDGGRDRRRNGWFGGAYGNGYPGWAGYPYPFVIDPGFYDWSDSEDGGYDQGVAATDSAPYTQDPYADSGAGYPAPMPYLAPAPYPAAPMAPSPQGAYPGPAAVTAATEEPLTLIFKDGRAPEKMQNYIMNAKALTDMDPQHYERIPLDQIDVAATAEFNRTRGVDFEVPAPGPMIR